MLNIESIPGIEWVGFIEVSMFVSSFDLDNGIGKDRNKALNM